jgi:hypothetical protein
MSTKPLVFIEPEEEPPVAKPRLKRQLTYLKNLNRPLWQEDDRPPFNQSVLDEFLLKKAKGEMPKVTFTIDSLECGRDGTCSECKLSREIEESYHSEKDKCTQQ